MAEPIKPVAPVTKTRMTNFSFTSSHALDCIRLLFPEWRGILPLNYYSFTSVPPNDILVTHSRIVGYSSIATIGLRPPPDVGRQKGCKVRIVRQPPRTPKS